MPMAEKQVEVVGVTSRFFYAFFLLFSMGLLAQSKDSLSQFKKKVLENIEIDMLMSYYEQEGTHAAVTGGIGNEYLTDYTPTIVVRIPMGENGILTADVGLSAYTSASSSNGNPFNKSGASANGEYEDDDDEEDEEDDDDDEYPRGNGGDPKGSPWVASTGASAKDVLTTLNVNYQHASEDRNTYWSVALGGSTEYDYESFSTAFSLAKLWNEKNTEFSVKGQLFFDRWKPIIPTEMHEYEAFQETFLYNEDSYFSGVPIINNQGTIVASYLPNQFDSYTYTHRNSYSISMSLSQILHPKLQGALFVDVVKQEGLLSNPLQRVYFQDRPDYYIGNQQTLGAYTSPSNTDLFHLADDVERLPSSRIKIPFGARLNYYLNEYIVFRSYARMYQDDWGIQSKTFQVELPVRLGLSWKITPVYRFYDQTAANYFQPYNQHLSANPFYTSDYDLSGFHSHQWGIGINYRTVFSTPQIFSFGLKSFQLRAQKYNRSDGLSAFIVSTGLQFVLDN